MYNVPTKIAQTKLPFTSGEMNPDVSIHKVTGRHSEVTYRPTLRDQAVVSSMGVKAQFIVRYDVARELAAADFQVRLAANKRQSSFYWEIMISRKKCQNNEFM